MSDVTVTFGAKDNGVESTIVKIKGSLNNLEKSTQQASDSFEGGFKKMAIAGGVAGLAIGAGMKVIGAATDAARAVVNRFGEALDLGGELSDLSARTGETAGNLLVLQRAFDNAGVGADKVGTAVNKLQKFITDASNGAATQSAVLVRLGLSMTDLAGMTPTQQMQTFAERISRIQNPTERAATAMQIFGKSGGELLPFLTNFSGEIANAKGELGSMPAIMDRSANAFDNIADKIAVVKGKVTEFAAGFLESALPAMNKFINAGSQLDAAKFGQVIGQKLTEAFELITSGDIWQIFRLQAEKAINQIRTSGAINNLAAFLNTVFEGITSDKNFNWDKTFEKYKSSGIAANTDVNDVIDEQIAELWRQAQNRSAEAAKAFEDQMQEAAANSAIMLKDIPEVTPVSKEIPKWLERLPEATDNANKDTESIKSNLKGGADAMSQAAEKVKEALTMSQQITEDIDQARKEWNVDPGGKEREKINAANERGDFSEAERRNKRLGEKERDIALRDKNGDGKDLDNRSVKDIAKNEGIDTFRKNNEQLRKEIMQKREDEKRKEAEKKAADEGKKRNDEMKPGNEGKKDTPKDQGKDSIASLASAVQSIANTVQAISNKLPQSALGA
jgi:hypothetical protein